VLTQESAIGRVFTESKYIQAAARSGRAGGTSSGLIDGQARLVAYRSLAHYPIEVVATTTVTDVLASWNRGALTMIAAVVLLGLVIGGAVFLSARIIGRKLRDQIAQRDVAFENMWQGLALFDAAGRLVVCNDRLRDLYGLPVRLTKSGCTVVEMLDHCVSTGAISGNPVDIAGKLLEAVARGDSMSYLREMRDGRVIAVVGRPVAGGGWVSTHTDVTERKRSEVALAQANAFFQTVIDNMPLMLTVKDASDLSYILINPVAEKTLFQVPAAAIIGKPAYDFYKPEQAAILRARDREALDGRKSVTFEHTIDDSSGDLRNVIATKVPILGDDGKPQYLITIAQDITDRKCAELALAQATQELIDKQYAIDQAVAFSMTDAAGNITYMNDKFCEISGYCREELVGRNHRMFNSGTHPESFFREMYFTIGSGGVWREEICNKAKNGSLYWVDTTIIPQLGADGTPAGYRAIRFDVTARKAAEAKISYMANHDTLTGLGNRDTLNLQLDEALARVRRQKETFVVLLLDLDGFKHVNDTLGHAAGDQMLKELAGRLICAFPERDTVVRLGGDEFAIIQSSEANPRETAVALALKVLDLVSVPVNLVGRDVTVGTSIGIALAPEDGDTPGELLQNADLALYRAKSQGRNSFCFYEKAMSRDAAARLKMLNDLRLGLTRQEFELHYQPIFDSKMRRPCGVEALVRWRHPIEGLVPPDRFIPLAEETGFIEQLGEWILEKACTDAAGWPDHIKIAINLSAMQFRSGKLFDVILCALVDSGLPPERLELEITESVLLQDGENVGVIIQQLKNIGVSIALDDFGTGYSSLVYLTKYPFDKVKIDKSFTQGLTNNAGCAASVASVLTLARALDMVVTAEGVETANQYELLRVAGVHQVQGYLFARPCRVDDLNFDELERKGRAVSAA
jgi:diguanylate cyclase (GGDEF)-like protein/PAS domain S-box-containing protein